MASINNPHFYGQSTTITANQIEDGQDFPHTGIIKALADGLGQNYAISGFDITTDSATQIDVGAGVIFRDGKRHAITAVPNLTLGRTDVGENSYHLVVVDKDNVIAIRSPSAKDKVAEYTVRTLTSGSNPEHLHGDTIIAVVTHNGNDPMPIQYLTVDKAENSLSIGYSNSGTYTEVSSITGTSAGLFISGISAVGTVAGSDKVLIQDAGSSDVIKTATASDIAALGSSVTQLNDLSDVSYSSGDLTISSLDKIVYANGGNAELSVATTSAGTDGRDLTISAGSAPTGSANQDGGNLILNAGAGDGTGTSAITLNTKVSGTDTVAERMRVHTNGMVGIGTNAPTTLLETKGDATFSRSADSGQTRTVIIEGARNATGTNYAAIDFKNYDSHGPTSYIGARIAAINEATGVNDGTLTFSTNNANAGITERMRIADSGEVRISGELEINGALNHDGANVGFYGVAPVTRQSVGQGSFATAGSNPFGRPTVDPTANPGFEPGVDVYMTTLEAEIISISGKLNALIAALQANGLIS